MPADSAVAAKPPSACVEVLRPLVTAKMAVFGLIGHDGALPGFQSFPPDPHAAATLEP